MRALQEGDKFINKRFVVDARRKVFNQLLFYGCVYIVLTCITCFLAYAAFALGFGAALLYLLISRGARNTAQPQKFLLGAPEMDDLIYRAIMIGFFLLTLGILTGAVWAESAWGRYWSWDPKETWSLITWLVYAALLHSRMVRGWRGKKLAILSIIGFCCVLFTYFGVNYLAGLHSYAQS